MKPLALLFLCLSLFGWREVINVSGKGTKQTETFNIKAKEWRVSWTVQESSICPKCGAFLIHVYKNDHLTDVAASVQGADSDSTIIRGSGDYYLKISGTEPWTVKVEAPTPD